MQISQKEADGKCTHVDPVTSFEEVQAAGKLRHLIMTPSHAWLQVAEN